MRKYRNEIKFVINKDTAEKLIKCIKEDKNERYIVLDAESEETYNYPFAKVLSR